MPLSNAERQKIVRDRKTRCYQLMQRFAARHGFTTNSRDASGIDEFMDSLESGEIIQMLLNDDDYTLALAELPRLAKLAKDTQSAELISDLVRLLPMEDE